MVILIVSDCQATATRLRHLLAQCGSDCSLKNVVPVDRAANAAASMQPKPDLVLFVLPRDVERTRVGLQQLRDSVDAHILAIGPRDPNLILCAVHAGANDFVDEEGELSTGLTAAVARVAAAARKKSPLGQLTTVIAASGGSGQTLVAANLAVAIAQAQGRCGLFDLAFRGSDVATFLSLKPRHTIGDLCRNIGKLDKKMWEQSLAEHETAVSVLAGPETWEETRQLAADSIQRIIQFGRMILPHTVLDLDVFRINDCVPILQESTAILVLFRIEFPSIRNAHRLLQLINRLGIDPSKVQLIASRYGQNKAITTAQAEAVLEMKIRHYIPDDSQIVNACINCGVPVVTESPRSSFARAILSIAETLPGGVPATQSATANSLERALSASALKNIRALLGMSSRELVLRPE